MVEPPIWKIWVKWDHLPIWRGENKEYLSCHPPNSPVTNPILTTKGVFTNPPQPQPQPTSTNPHPIYFSPQPPSASRPCYQEVAALLPSQSPPILPLKVWLVPRAHEDPASKKCDPIRFDVKGVVSGEPFIRGRLVAYISSNWQGL